jgi:hypothetical protein
MYLATCPTALGRNPRVVSIRHAFSGVSKKPNNREEKEERMSVVVRCEILERGEQGFMTQLLFTLENILLFSSLHRALCYTHPLLTATAVSTSLKHTDDTILRNNISILPHPTSNHNSPFCTTHTAPLTHTVHPAHGRSLSQPPHL